MGGIAGIIQFDGQAVRASDINALEQKLRHRGEPTKRPIDQGVLIAFGGTVETDPSTGAYALTDADLFDELGSHGSLTEHYGRNGPASFDNLNADFALALWDAPRQTLVCSRDSLGVKPLYYVHQPGRFFAFASEIKTLLALEEVTTIPNRYKFREYLTWTTAYVPYSAETFYEGIYSVLPGHYVQVSVQQVAVYPFWKPDFQTHATLGEADAYADLFQNYFRNAIDARMRGKTSVGAHLSGGLDSSSVSCMAQSLLQQQQRPSLHTFTIDTKLASTDESQYVQAVRDQYALSHHTVHPVADVLESILEISQLFDRPEHFIIPSSFHLSVSVKARQLACDCILTGHDGDSVITTGFDYIDELIDAQDWDQLETVCRQFVSHPERNLLFISNKWLDLSEQEKFEAYSLYVIGAEITRRFREQPAGIFFRSLSAQQQRFGFSTSAIIAYCAKRVRDRLAHRTLVDQAFSTDFRQKYPARPVLSTQELTRSIRAEQGVPVDQIVNTTNVICNEQLNHIGAYYGHQYSFPFFDRRVIELGLSTPLPVRFDRGRGRGLIRTGLQTVLPPAIVSRLSKANFVEYGNLSAQQLYQATREQFASPNHAIWEVIDRTIFATIVDFVFNPRIPMQKKTRYNWLLSRIIYLALWLGSLPGGKKAGE